MLSVLLSSPSYMTGPQSLALSLVPVFPSQTIYCQPVLLPLCSDRIWLPLTSTTLWYKASTVWDAGSLPLTSLLVYLLILSLAPTWNSWLMTLRVLWWRPYYSEKKPICIPFPDLWASSLETCFLVHFFPFPWSPCFSGTTAYPGF